MDNSIPMKDRWNSPQMEQLRAEFLEGKKPSACFRCWNEEKAGMPSLRQEYLQFGEPNYTLEDLREKKYSAGPEKMVIQVSNFCNFSCRTCHAADSSGFNAEGEHYAQVYGEILNRYRRPGTNNQIGIVDNRHFSQLELRQYADIKDNLRQLEFYGGEPMWNTTHLELLRDLIESGLAPKINLAYSTNGSRPPNPEHIGLWENFKSIVMSFSLDGGFQWHSYLRYPGQTSDFSQGVRVAKALTRLWGPRKMIFGSNVTVSLLNVYYLPEIVHDLKAKVSPVVDLHLAFNPDYYSIRHLPLNVKAIITEKLKRSNFADQFQGVINFMNDNEAIPAKLEEFVIWTCRMDIYRKQDFRQTFPEYYELLKGEFERYGTPENLKKVIADGKY